MTTLTLEKPIGASRTALLKQATRQAHEGLDARIMRSDPFADRARYALFVRVQLLFHRDIDALYRDAGLAGMLPDLAQRRRLPLIEQDLGDLDVVMPATDRTPAFGERAVDLPTALGWLYVAEGSNLGAAFLLKEAAKLDIDESFGARHLAAAPQGRGLHWRTFTAALDAVTLSAEEEARTVAGANDAFASVRTLVERFFPVPAQGALSLASGGQN